jgi:two-component system, OmpR family, heavy metal sensor histidine kinase CusS
LTASIRFRLTAWYAAALLLALSLFATAMWFGLSRRLTGDLDAHLDQRVNGFAAGLRSEGPIRSPAELRQELEEFSHEVPGVIELRNGAGEALQASAGDVMLPARTADHYSAAINGQVWRIARGRIQAAGAQYTVLAAESFEGVLGTLGTFRNLLLLMVPADLLLAALGGLWLSSRALRPVDAITDAARSISLQNLSKRVEVPRTGDELQRMAETWNQVLQRLENSVQRMRRFTADASHELRTPLALIRTSAELALRRDRAPEDYRAALRAIESEAVRMTALTDSLLTLARADARGFELTLGPTDVNEVVDSVVSQSSGTAAERGVALSADVGPPAIVAADGAAIRRLLLILVDNALKYTDSGGVVKVCAAATPQGVELAVEDTGGGIAPEVLSHIFERFYRAEAARSGDGFGLGLSIAQAIARGHGSEIRVKSTPGAGSKFSLLLRA